MEFRLRTTSTCSVCQVNEAPDKCSTCASAIFSRRIDCWPVSRDYHRRPRTLAVACYFETAEVGRHVCGSFAPYRIGPIGEKFASADLCLRRNSRCQPEDLSTNCAGCHGDFGHPDHVGREWILSARPAVCRRPTHSAERRNVFGGEKRDSLFRDGGVEGSDLGGRHVESGAVPEQPEVVTATVGSEWEGNAKNWRCDRVKAALTRWNLRNAHAWRNWMSLAQNEAEEIFGGRSKN